ncbi:threonine/serine exporter family protein [Clostridium sp. ATCC 25772]|uniref:threonine/serine exporter family protein n=1 Tax=Clostridium sp. ATCC 25772 TaxID=1676991 RepID=UPI00078426D4|nr:threonine/serine exporter family protein [Clostridium sp. ATCC 25772]
MKVLILAFIYAFISSLGFGILFNVRGKDLFFASLGGGLSWFVYKLAILNGLSDVLALFLGTLMVSIVAEICARVFKNPVTVYLICGLIPLVPGSGMYYTTFEAVKGNYSAALTKGIQTLFNAGSISVSVMFVSTLSRLLTKIILKSKLKKAESQR